MARSDFIVIVGCGRVGSLLANRMSATGHKLVVIDEHEVAFDKLSNEFSGFRIIGDAIEMRVLREARLEQADYLFAVTRNDNINLMVAQVGLKVFNVPRVIARVYDPAREALYREFGIETISPTKLTAEAVQVVLNANTPERKS